jgi:hypothetical protein
MFDLSTFTLRDVTELGALLRRAGDGARSMEETAGRVVRILHENLVDPATGARDCALVRFFKTHRYDGLDEALRDFARQTLDEGSDLPPDTTCLTLLATAGARPEWNDREASQAHRAIPLVSKELVSQTPMISNLLSQLGVEVEALLSPDLLVERGPSSFNVFYVPDAKGSTHIPAQDEFVGPQGIESVLGFGGMLPGGDIFVVILFSVVPIPRQTAELFRTLALNVKVAVLPFGEAVFAVSAR